MTTKGEDNKRQRVTQQRRRRRVQPVEEFLTVNEVAAALKLNPQTVCNWIDAGTLPAVGVSV